MKAANVSVLLQKGKISEDYYNKLNSMPKQYREIEIGLLEKSDPSYYTIISEGIREYRLKFGELNNIDGTQIVRIANDAMYINTSIDLPYIQIDKYILFRPKSEANVVIRLNKIIVFISFLSDGGISIDVKGISDDKYALHTNYILSVIATTAYYIERSSMEDAIGYISQFIEDYIKRKLDINYYRQFNSDSLFVINVRGENFGVPFVDDQYKDIIDINYNLSILRELWSIVLELYNRRK